MFVSMFEVAVFAVVGLVLLAPLLRGALLRARPATAGAPGTKRAEQGAAPGIGPLSVSRRQQPANAAGAGEDGRSAAGGDEARRRWAGRVGGALFAIAIMNFLAFSVHTRNLGGNADKRDEGRYYVAAHGRYTEVTEQQWRAVRAHEVAVFVTHPLGLLVGAPLLAYSQHRGGQAKAEPVGAPDTGRHAR
jgi:hypothetical protein